MRAIKKSIIGVIDWFLYTLLSSKQKQKLAGLLTTKQKETLKRLIKPGKKQAQMRQIERIKFKMNGLGMSEAATAELDALSKDTDNPYLRYLAAWELAVWHANQYSEAHARKCLDYLYIAEEGVSDVSVLRRSAILKAESYEMLRRPLEAEAVLNHVLASDHHPDLYLAMANLKQDTNGRVEWINQTFDQFSTSRIHLNETRGRDKPAYDRIQQVTSSENTAGASKVTIIIPVYNAADVIDTSLTSIMNQSWSNLEIFVVDDCSTDNTAEIARKYSEQDARITFLQTDKNGGPYVARNTALQHATGDYITINDADDWSHPDKIKTQAKHLDTSEAIANLSRQARATNDLKFFRRGKPGEYIFSNMSSLMFRRKPVMEAIGYWDSVRFAGDSEFLKRLKLAFGEKAIVHLKTAPLSFQRQSDESLTGSSVFGFPGFFMGVRKEYGEAANFFHARHPDKLTYSFPQATRPFPVPEPMWPTRADKDDDGRRHFDVITASDFRLLGGTNMSNIEEIKAQTQFGLKTGLVQLFRYDINPGRGVNPYVRELIDGEAVQMISYGEKVSCDVLITRHPPALETPQTYVPDIEAADIRVIANQTPKKEYSATGETLYDIKQAADQTREVFGQKGTWHPIGPLIRDVLTTEHSAELAHINLSDDDWINIIDVQEWRRTARPANDKIKIGRHSRDQHVKWPIDREELLKVYPESDQYEIHVLGGANVPKKLLGGQLPSNWHVHQFGDMDPRSFLAELDVFVYYTHPDLVEAFGRVIFEAMAVGVPVIIPPEYQVLFKEAAIYAEPGDVKANIQRLMNDNALYQAQVEKAQNYVETHFGYSKHASRLEGCLHGQ